LCAEAGETIIGFAGLGPAIKGVLVHVPHSTMRFYDAFLLARIEAGQPEALFVLVLFSGAAGEARDAGTVCVGGRWRIGSREQAWGHVPVLTCVGDSRARNASAN
jgi:hypothetical protein